MDGHGLVSKFGVAVNSVARSVCALVLGEPMNAFLLVCPRSGNAGSRECVWSASGATVRFMK